MIFGLNCAALQTRPTNLENLDCNCHQKKLFFPPIIRSNTFKIVLILCSTEVVLTHRESAEEVDEHGSSERAFPLRHERCQRISEASRDSLNIHFAHKPQL